MDYCQQLLGKLNVQNTNFLSRDGVVNAYFDIVYFL